MLADEMVALVAQQLGFRTDQNTNILTSMGFVQRYVLERLGEQPEFLNNQRDYSIVAGSTDALNLPADFDQNRVNWRNGGVLITSYDGMALAPESRENVVVTPKPLKEVEYWILTGVKSRPQYFAVDYSARVMRIALIPAKDTQIRLYYQAHDAAPELGQTNRWLTYASDLMLWETAVYMGAMLNQDITRFKGEALEARQRLGIERVLQDFSNTGPITVGMNR